MQTLLHQHFQSMNLHNLLKALGALQISIFPWIGINGQLIIRPYIFTYYIRSLLFIFFCTIYRYNDDGNHGDILINNLRIPNTNSTTLFSPLGWNELQGYTGNDIYVTAIELLLQIFG